MTMQGTLVRELTPLESSFALPWHRATEEGVLPMNVVIGVECTLSEAIVSRFDSTASILQRRHPLLRCSIGRGRVPDGDTLGALSLFDTDSPLTVEVRSASSLSMGTLESVQAECLNWKDPVPGALLARILAIRDESNSGAWAIYFVLSHAVFDGRSKQIVASEFFALLSNPQAVLPELDEATERMSFAEMLAAENVAPQDGMMDFWGGYFKARGGLKDAKLSGPSAAIAAQTATVSLLIALDATQTTGIVHKAKAQCVTVNSLLMYEWTTTVAGYAPFAVPAGIDLAAGGPMDARTSLGARYEHTLSNLFGPAGVVLASGASPEEHLRTIDSDMKKIKQNNWHVSAFSRPKSEKDMPGRWATAPLEELVTSFPNLASGFSNLGRMEFVQAEGVAVQRCWSAGGAYPDVNMICQCVTTAGVCTFSIQFVTPAHSRVDAETLVATFKARLLTMTA